MFIRILRWFLNLFQKAPYKDRVTKLSRAEFNRSARNISRSEGFKDFVPKDYKYYEIEKNSEPDPYFRDSQIVLRLKSGVRLLFPDGHTNRGLPWVRIGTVVRAAGACEDSYPYRIYLPIPEENYLPSRDVTSHEFGHRHLISVFKIKHHHPSFDWAFWGWSETREIIQKRLVGNIIERLKPDDEKDGIRFEVVHEGNLIVDSINDGEE